MLDRWLSGNTEKVDAFKLASLAKVLGASVDEMLELPQRVAQPTEAFVIRTVAGVLASYLETTEKAAAEDEGDRVSGEVTADTRPAGQPKVGGKR